MSKEKMPGEESMREMLGDELTDAIISKLISNAEKEEKQEDAPKGAVIFKVEMLATTDGLTVVRTTNGAFTDKFGAEAEVNALLDRIGEAIEEHGDDLLQALAHNETFHKYLFTRMVLEHLGGRK
jgi:hypothetical protein